MGCGRAPAAPPPETRQSLERDKPGDGAGCGRLTAVITLPDNALLWAASVLIATALLLLVPIPLLRKVVVLLICVFAGLAWSLYFVQERWQFNFPKELEGVDLQIEGRVDGLPRGDHQGATFAFVIANYTRLPRGVSIDVDKLPRRVYLTWSSAWRESEQIPIIQPGQQWQLRVKFKRPHGVINPHGFDFEQWLFHQARNGNLPLPQSRKTTTGGGSRARQRGRALNA